MSSRSSRRSGSDRRSWWATTGARWPSMRRRTSLRAAPVHGRANPGAGAAFAGLDDLADRDVYERARRMFAGEYGIESLPGGHFLHRESPDRFLAALLAFIKAA